MEKRYQYQTTDREPIGKSAFAGFRERNKYAKKANTLGFRTLQEVDTLTGKTTELTHYVTNRA